MLHGKTIFSTIDTVRALDSYPNKTKRLDHVHLNIVGPFIPSQGNSYCFTMVDRFTCWAEVVAIPDISVQIVNEIF